jgi:peptidoglycan/LPS O-acetylase OafA/YrhL
MARRKAGHQARFVPSKYIVLAPEPAWNWRASDRLSQRLVDYDDDDTELRSEQRMQADHLHERHSSGANARASNRQLPSLTPLRGIAALWVVLYHYCGTRQYFPNLDITPHSYFISKGYLGVDMFFMLSGFVMAHVYCRAFSEGVGQHYRGFMVARIARLYPLHIFVLSLFVATAVISQLAIGVGSGTFAGIPLTGPESLSALVANVFMVHGLAAGQLSWNYPSWSISVEFIAYLGFPFALPFIARASGSTRLILGALLFAALASLAALTKGDLDQWDGPITLLRCMPEFLLGTLLYFTFRDHEQRSWLGSDLAVLTVLTATLVCLHFGAPDLLIVALFAAIVLLAVANTGSFARFANIAPLVRLGEISYSLYLIQGFVQYAAAKGFDALGIRHLAALSAGESLALMLPMLVLSILIAGATYSRIEIAWRQHLRDLLGERRKTRPADALDPRSA